MKPVFIEPLLEMWGLNTLIPGNTNIAELAWELPDLTVLLANLVNYSAKSVDKNWYGAKEICLEHLIEQDFYRVWSAQDVLTFFVCEIPFGFHTFRQFHKRKEITEVKWEDTQAIAPEYIARYFGFLHYERPQLGITPIPQNIKELILAEPQFFPKCNNCGGSLTLSSNGHWKRKCC